MKKILCALLALLMLTACLASCQKNDPPEDSSDSNSGLVGDSEVSTASIDLSEYKIIYPQDYNTEQRASVTALVTRLKEAYGTRLKSGSDFLQTTEQKDIITPDKEILIGATNRKESSDAVKKVKAGEYVVHVTENKVIIYGSSEEALERAIDSFAETVIARGSLSIGSDYSKTVNFLEELYPAGSAMQILATQYKIAYPQSNTKNEQKTANALKDAIFAEYGKTLSVSVVNEGKVIVVGESDAALGYYDYKLSVTSDKILLSGGSATALEWAADMLVSGLKDKSFKLENGYSKTYEFDDKHFNPIINDITLFTPSWSSQYTPPTWLSNFDEKTYAVTSNTGRVTVKAHRGDCINYPENSIEGIASTILAGADAIELDVHTTKDGMAVLMHDETLVRTTNVNDFLGKAGYPSSTRVEDWSYEQLQSLVLLHNGQKTSYKIPTLYEALILCRGRIFVQIDDKSGSFANVQNDIYYIAKATDSMECFFHHYGLNALRAWSDKTPEDTAFAAYVEKCEEYLGESGHALRKVYWPNESPNRGTYTNYPLNETPAEWEEMISEGRLMFWSEDVLAVMKYLIVTKGQVATK